VASGQLGRARRLQSLAIAPQSVDISGAMTARPLGFAACLILALAVKVARADDVPVTEEARKHFNAGVAFLQDPDGARYEDAYREFQQAYSTAPSWKILGNLGLTAMKLERDGEAIDAYRRYINEGGEQIELEERRQALRDLTTLEASASKLTLEVTQPGVLLTDERIPVTGAPIVNRYGPADGKLELRVRPGHHRLTARAQGFQDATWEVDVKPSETLSHTFELTALRGDEPTAPPPAPAKQAMERPVPTGVYIGLAATGAFTVGAAVTGVIALGKKSDYDEANDGNDPAKAEDLKDSGQTLNLVTDVLVGAAVVSAGVTAVLYFTRPERPAEQESGRLALVPTVHPGGGGLVLWRSF
jgi:hypothetical protein